MSSSTAGHVCHAPAFEWLAPAQHVLPSSRLALGFVVFVAFGLVAHLWWFQTVTSLLEKLCD
jgi:hypothetical protein